MCSFPDANQIENAQAAATIKIIQRGKPKKEVDETSKTMIGKYILIFHFYYSLN